MKNYLSKEGLEKIKKELEYLKTVKREEITARLKQAISFGDLKENAAYDEAREAQGFVEGKIMELENILNNSEVVEKKTNGLVEIGSTVTISNGKEEDKYTIVSPPEADPFKGNISSESPLGKSLLGLKVGDSASINTPDGKVGYKILNVE